MALALRSRKTIMDLGRRKGTIRRGPKRHGDRSGYSGNTHGCLKVLCHHNMDDHPRVKNGMMKGIPGSQDHDLAFEAADVTIDEASIMNGQALISGTQLLEHKSNLSEWLHPQPLNLPGIVSSILHLVTHISHWLCAAVSIMVLSGTRTSFGSFSLASADKDQSFFATIVITAIVPVQACTDATAEAGILRGIVQLCVH